jgi:primosomal protein N' (replication factor Y)
LKNKYNNFLVGPAEPVINRIRNQYLMELLIKLPKDTQLIRECKRTILEQIAVLHNDKSYKAVGVVCDVDVV